jgi:2-polyprenyl-3-methyl-5-hydroxy-6-metoxy-1,4-benzoquinol methylase
MGNSISNIYKEHHKNNRKADFSILEEERGELLKEFIGINKNILDIGCRDGTLTKYFVKGNRVLGVDVDENLLNKASENLGIDTLIMDLNGEWGDLNGKLFDVIVAGEVVEHLYFPENVIKKAHDHLEKGGLFVGSIPNAFSLKNRVRLSMGHKKGTPLEDPTHINHFSMAEFKNILSKRFKNIRIIGLGQYKKLAQLFPDKFAFVLFFVAEK